MQQVFVGNIDHKLRRGWIRRVAGLKEFGNLGGILLCPGIPRERVGDKRTDLNVQFLIFGVERAYFVEGINADYGSNLCCPRRYTLFLSPRHLFPLLIGDMFPGHMVKEDERTTCCIVCNCSSMVKCANLW